MGLQRKTTCIASLSGDERCVGEEAVVALGGISEDMTGRERGSMRGRMNFLRLLLLLCETFKMCRMSGHPIEARR